MISRTHDYHKSTWYCRLFLYLKWALKAALVRHIWSGCLRRHRTFESLSHYISHTSFAPYCSYELLWELKRVSKARKRLIYRTDGCWPVLEWVCIVTSAAHEPLWADKSPGSASDVPVRPSGRLRLTDWLGHNLLPALNASDSVSFPAHSRYMQSCFTSALPLRFWVPEMSFIRYEIYADFFVVISYFCIYDTSVLIQLYTIV